MGLCSSSNNSRKKPTNKKDKLFSKKNNTLENNNNIITSKSNESNKKIINRLSKNTKFDNINNFYTISEKFLGKGATGIVREASDKEGKSYAIKTVWKSDIEQNECFKREIEITLSLDHESIVKCYDIYEDNNSIHFVLELVSGGDLFDHIIHSEGKKLTENEAIDILYQILTALHYLHDEAGIVHRDIKPENFLLYKDNDRIKVKLIDFGFAIACKDGETMTDLLGTPLYAAPEIFKEIPYTNKIDLWSTGVVLYNMVKGTQPFSSKADNIKTQVLNKEIDFSFFKTQGLKDLCQNLLERDPEKRFTAFQALKSLDLITSDVYNSPTNVAQFRPDINKIISILYNDRTIIEELKNIFLSECTYDELCKMYDEILLKNSHSEMGNNSNENNMGIVSDKLYLKAEKIIEFGQTSKYSPESLKLRLKGYCEQKIIEKIKKQMINVNKFFNTIIGSNQFIRKLRCLNDFQKLDKYGNGWISGDKINHFFIDPIKRNNIKKKFSPNDRIEFETFYAISNEYNGYKVKKQQNFRKMISKEIV